MPARVRRGPPVKRWRVRYAAGRFVAYPVTAPDAPDEARPIPGRMIGGWFAPARQPGRRVLAQDPAGTPSPAVAVRELADLIAEAGIDAVADPPPAANAPGDGSA